MIITVASTEQRAGKSTVAVNIAVLRALVGRAVLLIDIDPKKSAFEWSKKRNLANIQPRISACSMKGKHLKAEFETLTTGYNDILIHTEWRNSKGSQAALEVSHMVVVPVQLGGDSLNNLKKMERRIKVARESNRDLWVLVVISCAEEMLPFNELDAVRSYVARIPSASLAGTVIHEAAAVQNAFDKWLSIFEYKPVNSRAIAEMYDLYRAQKNRRAGVPSLSRLQMPVKWS